MPDLRHLRRKEFKEVSPDQMDVILGHEYCYKYLMQNKFKIYQSRTGGDYGIKFERQNLRQTDEVDALFNVFELVRAIREILDD